MEKSITNSKNQKLLAWLKEARESQGLSMRDFAERLEKPHSFVGKIETAERRLDVAEFVAYCEALGLDPHEGIRLLQNKSAT